MMAAAFVAGYIAAHPVYLFVFGALGIVFVILVAVAVWDDRRDQARYEPGHKAPRPLSRQSGAGEGTGRQARIPPARRLPVRTHLTLPWYWATAAAADACLHRWQALRCLRASIAHRLRRGLTLEEREAMALFGAMRAEDTGELMALHHEDRLPIRGDAQERDGGCAPAESRPAAGADLTGLLSPRQAPREGLNQEGPRVASAPPPRGTPDVPGAAAASLPAGDTGAALVAAAPQSPGPDGAVLQAPQTAGPGDLEPLPEIHHDDYAPIQIWHEEPEPEPLPPLAIVAAAVEYVRQLPAAEYLQQLEAASAYRDQRPLRDWERDSLVLTVLTEEDIERMDAERAEGVGA